MITSLLVNFESYLIWIVAIGVTIWWRSNHTYVYFGDGARMKSITKTFIWAFIASWLGIGCLLFPINWLYMHCKYLLDIVVAIGAVLYFLGKNKKDNENDSKKDADVISSDDNE